jgi:hypothetical protein
VQISTSTYCFYEKHAILLQKKRPNKFSTNNAVITFGKSFSGTKSDDHSPGRRERKTRKELVLKDLDDACLRSCARGRTDFFDTDTVRVPAGSDSFHQINSSESTHPIGLSFRRDVGRVGQKRAASPQM